MIPLSHSPITLELEIVGTAAEGVQSAIVGGGGVADDYPLNPLWPSGYNTRKGSWPDRIRGVTLLAHSSMFKRQKIAAKVPVSRRAQYSA